MSPDEIPPEALAEIRAGILAKIGKTHAFASKRHAHAKMGARILAFAACALAICLVGELLWRRWADVFAYSTYIATCFLLRHSLLQIAGFWGDVATKALSERQLVLDAFPKA